MNIYHFIVRRSLTIDSAHAIVRALIHSRLDYCNSLLSGLPNTLLSRLDGVMRAAARPHISTPVQRPRQPTDAWSTSLAERCIEDSIQTVRPGFSMSKWCHAIRGHRISPVAAFQSPASSVDRVCVVLIRVTFQFLRVPLTLSVHVLLLFPVRPSGTHPLLTFGHLESVWWLSKRNWKLFCSLICIELLTVCGC